MSCIMYIFYIYLYVYFLLFERLQSPLQMFRQKILWFKIICLMILLLFEIHHHKNICNESKIYKRVFFKRFDILLAISNLKNKGRKTLFIMRGIQGSGKCIFFLCEDLFFQCSQLICTFSCLCVMLFIHFVWIYSFTISTFCCYHRSFVLIIIQLNSFHTILSLILLIFNITIMFLGFLYN